MSSMSSFLPGIDVDKIARMQRIRTQYESGELTLDEARAAIKAQVGQVSAREYALMEQQFTDPAAADACRTERLSELTALFGDDLRPQRPALPEGHPIEAYYRENEALRRVIARMQQLDGKPFIKNAWLELLDELQQIRVHYSRKQNQLYSALERKGFAHPSTAMWTYDDANRDALAAARRLLDADDTEAFLTALREALDGVLDLMDKEEAVLLPVSLSMISDDEFREMCSGDDEIGYCLIAPPTGAFRPSPAAAPATAATDNFTAELQQLMQKHGLAADPAALLDVATGRLTLEQINLIYRHMPVDLSFVDENEIVRFYTDTKHRIFPRSKGVIGREVINCHPPKSLSVVKEVIEKLRSGEQDEAEFWINKPDLFIYITYTAVRDADGRFRGVLERMQDCTRIRSLTGSRTLLTWDAASAASAAGE